MPLVSRESKTGIGSQLNLTGENSYLPRPLAIMRTSRWRSWNANRSTIAFVPLVTFSVIIP